MTNRQTSKIPTHRLKRIKESDQVEQNKPDNSSDNRKSVSYPRLYCTYSVLELDRHLYNVTDSWGLDETKDKHESKGQEVTPWQQEEDDEPEPSTTNKNKTDEKNNLNDIINSMEDSDGASTATEKMPMQKNVPLIDAVMTRVSSQVK